ncbi:CDP-glycerol glycerophosphotransferase family protein [Kitasatospora sp. NPDC090308]|uniref:CDP-glycerol glycerophosphotransferase family protein n=1 Tax=Kitasatospora sp. NPDC090308 TaxID=3364082 RepID=UPI00380D562D
MAHLVRHRTPTGHAPRPAAPAAPTAYAALRHAVWDGDALVLHGEGRLDGHPGERPGQTRVVLELRPLGGSRRAVRLRTVPRYLPEATDDSAQTRHGLDWTGFTARLDPAVLRPRAGRPAATWRVEAAVASGRLLARAPLAPHWCGGGEYPPAGWSGPDIHLAPFTADGTLHLTVGRPPVRVDSCRARPDGFELRGTAGGPGGGPLVLRHRDTGELIQTQVHWQDGGFTAVVGTVPRPAPGHWDPALALPDGPAPLLLRHPPHGPGQLPLPGGGSVLQAKQLADGRVQFCVRPAEPRVDRISPADGAFELAGEFPGPADRPLELVLRHTGDGRERRAPVRPAPDGRFTARLPLAPDGPDGAPRPLGKGVWEVLLRPAGPDGGHGDPVRLHPAVLPLLPARARAGDKSFLLQRRWHDTLIVDSLPVLSAVERSAHRQHRLRTDAYPAARRRPLRDAVLYDVFGGRGYACNPRAVHAELARSGPALEHLWVVEDGQERPPEGVRAVRQWSPEWYEALATCRYLVGNTHFPEFLRRREGQVVVQLWHGTPLKRIAHRMPPGWAAADGYLERLGHEVRQWSLLLSPSPFATPELRASFRYGGEVLGAGYPRNDRLARPDRAEAAGIRRRLRLPPGRRVVLYAPTWRDDRPGPGGRHALDLRLDLAAARAVLGRDHVLLLRPHVHVGGALPDDDFVRDVADYPDVQDLLLIADVLVTDYSSVMFDFAVTGRPMLFFTYDLAHYRDALRGFTFDFERWAPGPLLSSSEQVVAALRDFDPARHRDAYRRFRARFCPLDDGAAAARVAARMLALGTGR